MRKLLIALACVLCLVGCSTSENSNSASTESPLLEKYSIGDEVELGGEKFNIYKIDDNNSELYLLAQSNVADTVFSDDDRSYKYQHDYEGSLVEGYVNKFVDTLEDKGYNIKASGIIDKDDLYELGFKHSDGLSGLPYRVDDAPEYVTYVDNFWVGGYCKYETMSWVYCYETLDTQSCDDEYGVRPIIVVDPSELDRQVQSVDPNLTIQEIVDSECAWISEGGIHNPYDRFYFDCVNLTFTNVFESSELSRTDEYIMSFIDERTIQVDGLMRGYAYPAEITIVSEEKLRVRFLDDSLNEGDYFLVKENTNN